MLFAGQVRMRRVLSRRVGCGVGADGSVKAASSACIWAAPKSALSTRTTTRDFDLLLTDDPPPGTMTTSVSRNVLRAAILLWRPTGPTKVIAWCTPRCTNGYTNGGYRQETSVQQAKSVVDGEYRRTGWIRPITLVESVAPRKFGNCGGGGSCSGPRARSAGESSQAEDIAIGIMKPGDTRTTG